MYKAIARGTGKTPQVPWEDHVGRRIPLIHLAPVAGAGPRWGRGS